MIHRGELLKKAVHLKFRSQTAAAKVLGISRTTMYRYFEQENLGDDLLLDMGKRLGYDFTKDDKSLSRKFMEEPVEDYVSKFLEKSMNDSVVLMVTVDGMKATLKRTIKKLEAINDLLEQQNFARS